MEENSKGLSVPHSVVKMSEELETGVKIKGEQGSGQSDWIGVLNSKHSGHAGFERLCTDVKSFMLKNVKGFGGKDHPKALVCALSGGIDSMMLSAVLHKVCQKEHFGKIKLHMVHINHNLQSASKEFESHCESVSKKMGWGFCVKNVYLNEQSGLKTEGEARVLRREALAKYASENEIEYVFFGNHADDLIEGHLLALSRGAALNGLSGFSAKSVLRNSYLVPESDSSSTLETAGGASLSGQPVTANDAPVGVVYALRPLIGIGKAQLKALIEQIGLPFVEDPTNAQSDYERNALRHSLAQNWDLKRPGWRKAAVRSLELLAQERSLLSEYKSAHLKRLTNSGGQLNVVQLGELSKEMAISLLHDWSATKIGQSLHESHLSALYDFFVNGNVSEHGKRLWKFNVWEFNVKNGFLHCTKELKDENCLSRSNREGVSEGESERVPRSQCPDKIDLDDSIVGQEVHKGVKRNMVKKMKM